MDLDAPEIKPPPGDCRPWRLLATALSFVVFGIGALFLRLAVFPIQGLLPGDTAAQQQRARLAVMMTFRLFIRFLVWMRVITLQFHGADRLGRPGQLIIANHPSLLDVVLLVAHIRDTNCIVKHRLTSNPFTRGPVEKASYISNNESLEMLERATSALLDGQTLVMFPEGTRTAPGCMPRFHRSACAIALRGARVVTPVIIRMNPPALAKGQPWYHIPARRIQYEIHVGEDIDPARWLAADLPPSAGRKMNLFLHQYFEARLS